MQPLVEVDVSRRRKRDSTLKNPATALWSDAQESGFESLPGNKVELDWLVLNRKSIDLAFRLGERRHEHRLNRRQSQGVFPENVRSFVERHGGDVNGSSGEKVPVLHLQLH